MEYLFDILKEIKNECRKLQNWTKEYNGMLGTGLQKHLT